MASVGRSAQFPCRITSSIRYFDVNGRTRPARRLTIINARPRLRRFRWAQMIARASSQAPFVNLRVEGAWRRAGLVPSVVRGRRAPWVRSALPPAMRVSFNLPMVPEAELVVLLESGGGFENLP